MSRVGVVPASRLVKFGCGCGLRHRVVVRTRGDSFTCNGCNVRYLFSDESSTLAEASARAFRATLNRFRARSEAPPADTLEVSALSAELKQARARAETAEAALADLERRKRIMECEWVNQTLALYKEFEHSLRPRVNQAERERDAIASRATKAESALDGAKGELEVAWDQNEQIQRERGEAERQHQRSLNLLGRTSGALESQLKLLRALRPLLRACADSPTIFSEHGIDVDSLFCRAAILKALEQVKDA